jgi:hypothetical protein
MPSLISALFLTLFFLWLPLRSKSPIPNLQGTPESCPIGKLKGKKGKETGPFFSQPCSGQWKNLDWTWEKAGNPLLGN